MLSPALHFSNHCARCPQIVPSSSCLCLPQSSRTNDRSHHVSQESVGCNLKIPSGRGGLYPSGLCDVADGGLVVTSSLAESRIVLVLQRTFVPPRSSLRNPKGSSSARNSSAGKDLSVYVYNNDRVRKVLRNGRACHRLQETHPARRCREGGSCQAIHQFVARHRKPWLFPSASKLSQWKCAAIFLA